MMISVCITTHNGERYIKDQIESILYQLSQKDEIVISDDNSYDQTVSIIRSINDKRIRILNSNFSNLIKNIENALNHSEGDIIFLADQDDVWLPNKVKICSEALKNNDLVVSDCYVTDSDLKIIHESFYKLTNYQTNKWKALLRNPYLGCCMAFNRSVLQKSIPFPGNIPMHDIWIGNVAAFNFKVRFIPEKLIYYRRHGLNSSTASEPTKASLFQQIKFRTSVIEGLMKLK